MDFFFNASHPSSAGVGCSGRLGDRSGGMSDDMGEEMEAAGTAPTVAEEEEEEDGIVAAVPGVKCIVVAAAEESGYSAPVSCCSRWRPCRRLRQ